MPTLETLATRRVAVLEQISKLNKEAFFTVDEEAHRAAIAQAKVQALGGDTKALNEAVNAHAADLKLARGGDTLRQRRDVAVGELESELKALDGAIEAEQHAREERRRTHALEVFRALAEQFDAHARQALDLLPDLVSVAAFMGPHQDTVIRYFGENLKIPTFSAATIDPIDSRVAAVPVVTVDRETLDAAIEARRVELEAIE